MSVGKRGQSLDVIMSRTEKRGDCIVYLPMEQRQRILYLSHLESGVPVPRLVWMLSRGEIIPFYDEPIRTCATEWCINPDHHEIRRRNTSRPSSLRCLDDFEVSAMRELHRICADYWTYRRLGRVFRCASAGAVIRGVFYRDVETIPLTEVA